MLSTNSSIGCRLNSAGRALANASMVEWRPDLAVVFLGRTGTADMICNGSLELRCLICFDASRALPERALWFPENHKHAAPKIRR
jgi:hypothetical protein